MKKGLIALMILGGLGASAQSTDGLSIVFEDNFANNKSAWLVEETGKETSWVNYNEKRLVFDGNVGGAGRVTMNAPKGFNGDFLIKANVWCKECSGNEDANFGILVGYDKYGLKSEQGWYQLRLLQADGDGVWIKANNSNGTTLYEQTLNAAFDPDDKNEIAIEKRGDEIKYYVNGSVVFTNVSTETSGNKISFLGGNKIKVFMSDISMYSN